MSHNRELNLSTDRTPLLGDQDSQDLIQPAYINHSNDQNDDDDSDGESDDNLEEEPLSTLLSRYGTPAGSLGLSGGVGVFGTSLTRHNSVPAFSQYRVEPVTRPRRPTMHHIRRTTGSPERGDLSKPRSTVSVVQDSTRVDGQVDVSSKFLYGVSEPHFWACFSGILLAYFVACFDSTLMASSHPVITSYFDASNSASWLSTSFLLTSTAFQPMYGRMSDTFGRKIPFIFSLVSFLLGTLWCALAGSMLQFILARAICGLGAGGALAMGAIILSDLIPLETRSGYLAYLNLAYGIGSSLGAAMGGFLAEALGWRWEFGIQVPGIFFCVLVAFFSTPTELGPMTAKRSSQTLIQTLMGFDIAGFALLTSSVTFLILALNMGGNVLPWTHPLIIFFFILFFVLGAILIHVERRADKPVMPLHMLLHVPQSNLIIANFLACMTMNTILFNVPLYFQAVILDSPTRSGLRLLGPFLGNMVAAFMTGNYIAWTLQVKPTLLLGAILIAMGSMALALMPRNLPELLYSWLIGLATSGQGFQFPTISIAILAVSASEDMAVATSTLMLFRSLGTVMGVAVSSLVVQNGLSFYLDKLVTVPNKSEIIQMVRSSVEAVVELNGIAQEQVIDAYAATMQLTFAQGIITAVVALLLVVFIKIPRLSNQPLDTALGE